MGSVLSGPTYKFEWREYKRSTKKGAESQEMMSKLFFKNEVKKFH